MKPQTKKILNIIITIVLFALLVVGLFFLLKKLGVTDQASLQTIINKTGVWAPLVFILLQIATTTLLSVVPATSLTFLILAGIIFDNLWLALLLPLVGVWISSVLMFYVGKSLGEKVAIKLVGKESLTKAQDLIDTKTKVYLPVMFLFPFFPDDGLCLAAGMTKMKYRYFIPVVVIFRSVGAITTVLTTFFHRSLYDLLGLATFTPIDWVLLVNVLAFDVYVIYKITTTIEKKINEKKKLEAANIVVEENN